MARHTRSVKWVLSLDGPHPHATGPSPSMSSGIGMTVSLTSQGHLTGPAWLLLQGRNQRRSDKEAPSPRLPYKLSHMPETSLLYCFSPFFFGIWCSLLRYLSTFPSLLEKGFCPSPSALDLGTGTASSSVLTKSVYHWLKRKRFLLPSGDCKMVPRATGLYAT